MEITFNTNHVLSPQFPHKSKSNLLPTVTHFLHKPLTSGKSSSPAASEPPPSSPAPQQSLNTSTVPASSLLFTVVEAHPRTNRSVGIWELNNQKIAFVRAALIARMLNRTLLMPCMSASLFYKEADLLQPISFDKVFQFETFNSLCKGFVQLGRYSKVSNRSDVFELKKGRGRRWTVAKYLDQLRQFSNNPYDRYEIIQIFGKNPFLWVDHWPVKDYAKVFECLVLVEEISREADKIVSRFERLG